MRIWSILLPVDFTAMLRFHNYISITDFSKSSAVSERLTQDYVHSDYF